VADASALQRTAEALRWVLQARLDQLPPDGFVRPPRAFLIQNDEFDPGAADREVRPPALSVFVHRVAVNHMLRPGWSAATSEDGRPRLPLDLHVLLTAWGESAQEELRLLGEGMLALEAQPVLAPPLLPPQAGFAPAEAVQVTVEDLPVESLLRIFEAMSAPYRLSIPYIARVVRTEDPIPATGPEVRTVLVGARPTVALP
jgi:hypothetical protein